VSWLGSAIGIVKCRECTKHRTSARPSNYSAADRSVKGGTSELISESSLFFVFVDRTRLLWMDREMRNELTELTERTDGQAMLFPSASMLNLRQLPVLRCKFAYDGKSRRQALLRDRRCIAHTRHLGEKLRDSSMGRAKKMQDLEVYSMIGAEGFTRLVAASYRQVP
jgi:hypothetical protein